MSFTTYHLWQPSEGPHFEIPSRRLLFPFADEMASRWTRLSENSHLSCFVFSRNLVIFRLVSYNIHKGIGGVDRRYRPDRIIETLRHYAGDVVLLQEVDDGVPRSRHHRQVDYLGDALEMPHRAYQRNVKLRHGHYGNAILSRWPLHEIHEIDLTIRWKKRRGALVVRLDLSERRAACSLNIVNVHLGLAGFERAIQIRRILADMALERLAEKGPLIVAGDFNDGGDRLGTRWLLPAGFEAGLGKVRTFPAVLPVRPLDRIFYRGDLRLLRGFAGHTKLARQASDHLPVVAEFELPPHRHH